MGSSPKLRAFLLLRYTLIIATAYLLVVEHAFAALSPLVALLIALALASNVAVGQLPRRVTDSTSFAVAVIVYDTGWVTAALVSSGEFGADFFMLYFFLLLLAAIGENLRLIAITAAVVCAAYLFGRAASAGPWDTWTSAMLIRIPFLFSTAIFYGHMVERTRQEGRRADRAETLAAQLARTVGEFKILYAKAQEAERIKSEFLAAVSHELRTPLTSLIGYVELLSENSYGPVSGEQRAVLARVRAASGSLHHVIARMLDASRIDHGYERLSCREFALGDVLDGLRGEFDAGPDVSIDWTPAAQMPALRTDEEKLRTVVRNLLDNACKYTPRGLVRIESTWDRQRDELEVRVIDTGIGIASAELETIFEAFRRGDNRSDTAVGGVGLGLYIVQRLVARLGGEIAVQSQLGMGSTFTVRVPRLLHRGAAVPAGPWGTSLRA